MELTQEDARRLVSILTAFEVVVSHEKLPENDAVLRAQCEAYLVARIDEVRLLVRKIQNDYGI